MNRRTEIATSKTPRNDRQIIPKRNILALRQKLLRWYRANKRDLPWRRTRDPYAILVSEVMLQQTQVDRVIPKYKEFLKRFPTIEALAQASLGDVLKLWSGLGYNRRAKYLKEMAEVVINGYKGQIPDTYDELRKLPGVGDYTANAILCFAFKKKAPAVDTNVRNVMDQEFLSDANLRMHTNVTNKTHSYHSHVDSHHSHRSKQNKKETPLPLLRVKQLLLQLMPQDHPDEFLHALMDYSSMRLTRPNRGKRDAIPFKQSNRYLRGRILARITHHPYHSKTLISAVQKETKRSDKDITRALDSLLKENLIRQSRGLLRLPSGPMATPRQSLHAPGTSGSNAR